MKKNILFTMILIIACIIYIYRSSSQAPMTSTPSDKQSTSSSGTKEVSTYTLSTDETAPIFQDGKYSLSIPSSIGIITYYNQTDARWGSTMYGGNGSHINLRLRVITVSFHARIKLY